MGINTLGLSYVKKFSPCESLLSLSYPDMVMSQEELNKITGFQTEKETDFGRWHGRKYRLPDTDEVFTRLGISKIRYVDIVASRGREEIADLNLPQDFGKHDIVLDCGTTEHCANIWQATINAANAVKVGGIIIHTPPLTMINHGFYCVQPTFYYDLYTQNNWRIVAMMIGVNSANFTNVHPIARFEAPSESSIYVVAQRNSGEPIKYPIQSKYLNNSSLR
jgi:hypothetical protein